MNGDARYLIKLVSSQLGAEKLHAEVFDEVRPFVIGTARNFRYAVG